MPFLRDVAHDSVSCTFRTTTTVLYCKMSIFRPINILNSTFSNRSAPDRGNCCVPSGQAVRLAHNVKKSHSSGSLSSSQQGGPLCWTSPLAFGLIAWLPHLTYSHLQYSQQHVLHGRHCSWDWLVRKNCRDHAATYLDQNIHIHSPIDLGPWKEQSKKVLRAIIPVKKGPFKYCTSCRLFGEISLKRPERGRILKKH